jgi:hypothetical protein
VRGISLEVEEQARDEQGLATHEATACHQGCCRGTGLDGRARPRETALREGGDGVAVVAVLASPLSPWRRREVTKVIAVTL